MLERLAANLKPTGTGLPGLDVLVVVEDVVGVVLGLDLGDRRRLPPDRTVVKFDFREPKRRYWMVLEPSEVSVCLQHPGFDVDLEVGVDTAMLYRVYLGQAELGGAIRAGQLTMSGSRTLQRGFGRWFTWSAFAPASRSAQKRFTATSRLAGPHRVRSLS
jgi:hypothetical protein